MGRSPGVAKDFASAVVYLKLSREISEVFSRHGGEGMRVFEWEGKMMGSRIVICVPSSYIDIIPKEKMGI